MPVSGFAGFFIPGRGLFHRFGRQSLRKSDLLQELPIYVIVQATDPADVHKCGKHSMSILSIIGLGSLAVERLYGPVQVSDGRT